MKSPDEDSSGNDITFLEETFSVSTAPPEHRYHQKAARAVLKTLFPESGTDIKGTMRSHAELLDASGYANHLDQRKIHKRLRARILQSLGELPH